MPEYGQILGSAVDLGFDDKINDLRYNQLENRRALAQAEAKAKMFADDLDYQNAANSYDNPLIKDFAKNKIKEIGAYARNNPDYLYNPDKLAQLNLMKKELRDNEHINRGLASDTAYKSYLKDLQEVSKNPNQHDTEAYQDIQNQWNNYLQHGNQDGVDAANKYGAKAFVYTKPKDFVDLPSTMLEAGNSIKNYDVKKGKNIGEYWTEPKANEVKAIKDSIYQQHSRQIMVEANKLGLITPEQIDKWVTDNISAGFEKKYSVGDPNAAFSNAMIMRESQLAKSKAEGKEVGDKYTTWDDFIKSPAGIVSADVLRKVWGDKPPIKVTGNNGAVADLSGNDFDYDGRHVNINGVKFLTGTVNLPLDVAEEKGILNKGTWFTDKKITSDYLDKAEIVTKQDKDGEERQYVKVKYELPVDTKNQTSKSMYEINTMPSRLVESAVNLRTEIPSASKQDWLNNGWTEEQIKQAESQGKIKVQ